MLDKIKIKNILFLSILLSVFLLLPVQQEINAAENNPSAVLSQLGDEMAKIAEQVKPAIVNISTTRTVRAQRHPFFDDPFFRKFFGDELQRQQQRKVTSLGSGVIATHDGYILTNNHVIEGAEDILVRLFNNKEYKGRVVGKDKRTDLAVIQIDAKNLPTIRWGDSDRLRVGDLVLAVGNPFGLNQTITMGIISALGRTGIGITDFEDYIQTDAAINPGNSGGALVNIKGEIVGINTAIFSTTGGYQGIGFAIPVNMAKSVMNSIIAHGKVIRGWLGVQIQPLTPELIKQFNLKEDDKGVLLSDVVEGGPAEKGKLKRGDVIVEFDGKIIESPLSLRNMVAASAPGQTVRLKVIREGKQIILNVVVGELPSEIQTAATAQPSNTFRGIMVQELTDEFLKREGITRKIKGVVISGIDENSPAWGKLREDDIITEINRQTIANVSEFNNLSSKIKPEQDVLFSIIRDKSWLFLVIPGKTN